MSRDPVLVAALAEALGGIGPQAAGSALLARRWEAILASPRARRKVADFLAAHLGLGAPASGDGADGDGADGEGADGAGAGLRPELIALLSGGEARVRATALLAGAALAGPAIRRLVRREEVERLRRELGANAHAHALRSRLPGGAATAGASVTAVRAAGEAALTAWRASLTAPERRLLDLVAAPGACEPREGAEREAALAAFEEALAVDAMPLPQTGDEADREGMAHA